MLEKRIEIARASVIALTERHGEIEDNAFAIIVESAMRGLTSNHAIQDLERHRPPTALVVIAAMGLFNIAVTVLALLSD